MSWNSVRIQVEGVTISSLSLMPLPALIQGQNPNGLGVPLVTGC